MTNNIGRYRGNFGITTLLGGSVSLSCCRFLRNIQPHADEDIRFIHLFAESLINKVPLTSSYEPYPMRGSFTPVGGGGPTEEKGDRSNSPSFWHQYSQLTRPFHQLGSKQIGGGPTEREREERKMYRRKISYL